jgi:hypothetical protein
MRKFIKNTFLFIVLISALVVLATVLVHTIIGAKANFKIKSAAQNIILGHSHPECAFNDSLIFNFSNCAKSGEAYFYTYFKAQKIIEQNKNIKNVFIEFTNNNIDTLTNGWIWGNHFISNNYPAYAPFMNGTDNYLLFKNNFSGYLNALSLSLRNNFTTIIKKDFSYNKYMCQYLYSKRSITDSLLILQKTEAKTSFNATEISKVNIQYLEKIIQYCKNKGVKVYLIRSPLHKSYRGYCNEKRFKEILHSHFSEIEFLDFSRFPLSNSEFGDLEHLNFFGVRKFSIWFNQIFKQGLLNQTDKQAFIDLKIKDYSF